MEWNRFNSGRIYSRRCATTATSIFSKLYSVLIGFFKDNLINCFFFNISDHGECDEGSCRCEGDWIGVACDEPLCPSKLLYLFFHILYGLNDKK